jgi:pyruvate formate lyase activating enzyme
MLTERFETLLPWVDWVGFDVKAPFPAYSRITGVDESGDRALASLLLLLESKTPYEIRTTLHPTLLSTDDMLELKDQLLVLGVTQYAVQRFRAQGVHPGRLPAIPEQGQLNLPPGYGDGFQHFCIR